MSERKRRLLSVLAIVAVAVVVWLPTIGWGLPSRDADRYLFGDRRPWTGAEIVALTATTMPTAMRGADVDADPILDRSKPLILNDTDAKRAAIVRRYRLMSGQPDEFIQFKAMSEMAARSGVEKLDPRLYQYGGLWMYPVGAMVRASMLVGLIQTPPTGTPAIEFYLDHPEAFGRFYVVARFYSWCWGLVAAFAIVWLARRITGSTGFATLAAVAFMLTPVVRAATHEAKPHLAGAALCLCVVIAATRYVETGRRRWLIGAGVLCGAAMAMVVSMLLSCVVLPTMVWLRWRAERRLTLPRAGGEGGGEADATLSSSAIERQRSDVPSRQTPVSGGPLTSTLSPYAGEREPTFVRSIVVPLVASLAVAAVVYSAANPFVLINAIAHPEIIRSNLRNSSAMYSPASDGFDTARTVGFLVLAALGRGTLPTLICVGTAALCRLCDRRSTSSTAILLSAVVAIAVAQFVLLASGKPAEYARFGLLPVAATAVVVAAAFAFTPRRARGLLVVLTSISAIASIWIATRVAITDRFGTGGAVELRHAIRAAGAERVGRSFLRVNWEPAPWSAPPFDLFRVEILLTRLASPDDDHRVAVYPTNLASQLGVTQWTESVDWRDNRFVIR